MALKFPDLKSKGCRNFVACARVMTDDETLKTWLSTDRTYTAIYMKDKIHHYVRMMTGKGEKDNFHLEVATQTYFAPKHSPIITNKMDDVRECAAKVWENKMEVWCKCTFDPLFSDLPERGLIRGLSIENTIGNVSMRLNSGALVITGAPLQRISWVRSVKTGTCAITLDAAFEEVLNDTYLSKLFDSMYSLFQASILGKGFEAVAKI